VLLRARLELLEEVLRARPRDGAEVQRELLLRHADARVLDDEPPLLRLRADAHGERALPLHERGLRQRPEAELVERVRRVGDELAEEDLLVRVEGVDDEREDAADLGLERMDG